jgi:putative ABC transport system permease protein
MLAACIGVLVPLRDIFMRRPGGAPKRQLALRARARLTLAGGMLCLLVTTIIILVAPQAAVIGVIALTMALLLLLPRMLYGVLRCVEWLTRDLKAKAPFVAVRALRAGATRTRTVAIAATGAIAVFGSVAIQAAHGDLQSGLNRAAYQLNAVSSLWVSPAGPANTLATIPFEGANNARLLTHLPGVAAVRVYRGSLLNVGDRRTWVIAPPPESTQPIPPSQLVSGELALASTRIRNGGWVSISQAIVDKYHLHIGQSLQLPSPRPATLRLAAVTTNFGWSPGVIVMNAEDYARAWNNSEPSAYQIELKPGISPVRGRREVRAALGRDSSLAVQTAAQREQADRETQHQGLARLNQISTLVLIGAALAMAAAMASMIYQRRTSLAELKLDGFTNHEVWRTLVLESVLLLGSGCLIGALFGLFGQLLASHALLKVTGFPVVFSFGAATALKSLLFVSAVSVTIVAVPGYFVARVRPAAGL